MSKYSLEFKLKVVKYCIEEHHSTRDAAKKFRIPSQSYTNKGMDSQI